jgi:nitroreductase
MHQYSAQEVATFDHIVRERHSVRGFLPEQIPGELMRKVFETARWSPSGTNVQPWQICVASGATRDRIRAELLERVANKVATNPDHPGDAKVGDVWRDRKRACARALYGAMGIEWEDRAGRGRAAMRNHELFDAPHVAFLCIDDVFGKHTVMLAMSVNGIGSCAQGSLRDYPDLVRDIFGLAPEVKVLFGISFGFEDPDVPANQARTERAAVSETVQFLD